jgi:hypothetical protein
MDRIASKASLLRAKVPLQDQCSYTSAPSSIYVSSWVASPLMHRIVVQMMSIAVECMLLVPKLRTHVLLFNVCADMIKIGEVGILNQLHLCMTFSNLCNAFCTKAIVIFINLMFGCRIGSRG